MKIKNVDGLTAGDIKNEIANGAKFVLFQYTVSIIILTFKRSSDIYFVKVPKSLWLKACPTPY